MTTSWCNAIARWFRWTAAKPITKYDFWTRDRLVRKIISLEAREQQRPGHHAQPIRKRDRPFDINKYNQHRVAFKVAYLGWNYHGFADQNGSLPTVEREIFRALEKSRMIESRETCDFSRCGRTDRGVSGMGQVIALNVRSSRTPEEIPYLQVLNGLLPDDIRLLAWAHVPPTFSARFDCRSRTYRYLFTRETLDIEQMRQAASHMMGTHDFRNFCRLDPSKNIKNYERTILSLDIRPLSGSEVLWEAEIKGTAFLWHQVRCIMSILFLVGQRLEHPDVVLDLLDISKIEAKPEYAMASDLPLLFYDCEFDKDIRLEWTHGNDGTANRIHQHWQQSWGEAATRAWLTKTMMNHTQHTSLTKPPDVSIVRLGAGRTIRTAHYKPLLSRPRADSDEVKKSKYRAKLLKRTMAS